MRTVLYAEKLVCNNSAPWVVFIHGAGGNVSTWIRQRDTFSKYFRLLFIDLRDHGNSKNIKPDFNRYSFEVVSKDIKCVLDEHGIHRAHFVTLSFGSILLQDFAFRYKSYIHKIVFAGAVFDGGISLRLFVQFARFLNCFLSYPTMYRLFSYILMPRKQNQFARRLYQTQSKKISQSEYMKWMGLYHEFFRVLRAFRKQATLYSSLVIMGNQDFMFLKSSRKFCAYQKRSSLLVVENAGHIVNIEKADEFNRAACAFLLAD